MAEIIIDQATLDSVKGKVVVLAGMLDSFRPFYLFGFYSSSLGRL